MRIEHPSHRVNFAVAGTLLVLTVVTWGVAHLNLGPWNTPVALLIALVKISLVAAVFMHLARGAGRIWIALLAALFLAAVLVIGTASDFVHQPPQKPAGGRSTE